jgi:TetR/AcrR family transcriptional regulator
MPATASDEAPQPVSADPDDRPPKQWEIRAAMRAFQRSREGSGRRPPAELMVSAAWELVDEDIDFTVKDVAERAGVALQTFYRHFGSKDELLLAMLEEGMSEGAISMAAAAAKLEGPIERLRYLVKFPIEQDYAAAGALRRLQWRARERQRISQRFPEAVDEVHEPYRGNLANAIAAAAEAGLLQSANPVLDATCIQYLVLTMTHLVWGGGTHETPESTAEAVWHLCWNGLAPRPDPS